MNVAPARPIQIDDELHKLFAAAHEEIFEDGMESAFSRNLLKFIKTYGDTALDALMGTVSGEHFNSEVISEALRWVGRIVDFRSQSKRRQLLELGLKQPSGRVRDGAALGLAFMDDLAAIPSLMRAIEREEIPELRKDMEQVLAQLRDTLAETTAQ